ncbi:Ku protein [Bradyrhizobium sp. ARR65]|uniref:non-homologous end joining protein Ku n=1 Tax=Bradyrhizobium sp. ARR65 TaxID=1040989 RepID=UPI000463C343|nr:Ku protein [Bradyrhizobium sp. ARR65]
MPASRAYWKGYLKLSFVSCPIALYPATSAAERLSFRQINRRTGHRLKHELVDSVTHEAVDSSNKARGYQVGANEFLLVEDRDLEQARNQRPPPGNAQLDEPPHRESPPTVPAGLHRDGEEQVVASGDAADDEYDEQEIVPRARPRNTRTIEIQRFLPEGQIDARYFEKSYYIAPSEEIGQESFAVIRDAMTREGVIGLARVVLSSRERPFLVEPMGQGLRGVTLRFAHEVRAAEDYFGEIPEIKLPVEMMNLARNIIRTKSAEFDPSMLEDYYRTALVRILRKRQAKRPAHHPLPVKPSRENVVNLMDALRRSIAAEGRAKSPLRCGPGKSAGPKRPARARKAG